MKFKYMGNLDAITLRGVTFEKGKAVDVSDDNLAEKISALDFFAEVKPRKAKDDDNES